MEENGPKNLGIALRRLIEHKLLSQDDVAVMGGLDKSTVSRLLNLGPRAHGQIIDQLLMAFPDPADQYELVRAHLQDELSPRARAVLDLKPALPKAKRPKLTTHNLSILGLEALACLLHNPHIEPIFIDLARALGAALDSESSGSFDSQPLTPLTTCQRAPLPLTNSLPIAATAGLLPSPSP